MQNKFLRTLFLGTCVFASIATSGLNQGAQARDFTNFSGMSVGVTTASSSTFDAVGDLPENSGGG